MDTIQTSEIVLTNAQKAQAKREALAVAARAISPFAGKTVAELIADGSPDAMTYAKGLVVGSGILNADVATGNEWGNGIMHGTYSDVFTESGQFETFENSKNAAKRKISGRYLKDSTGRRVKFYNSYLRLLPEGVAVYNEILGLVLFNKVSFGIMATPDGANLSVARGADKVARKYAGVIHSFAKKPFDNPAPIAPVLASDEEIEAAGL